MWFYCKYCVGTGRHFHKSKSKACIDCSGTGVVSEHTWLAQEHTLGGTDNFTAGFGPVPSYVAQSRLDNTRKITRLKSCLIRFGLRLKLKLATSKKPPSFPLI